MVIILIIDDAPHHVPELNYVPRKGENVKYDKIIYRVDDVTYALNMGEIIVHLRKY